ncbi:MAG: hypothetical protein AB7P03_28760 [Kofleriaceae bacterium]
MSNSPFSTILALDLSTVTGGKAKPTSAVLKNNKKDDDDHKKAKIKKASVINTYPGITGEPGGPVKKI